MYTKNFYIESAKGRSIYTRKSLLLSNRNNGIKYSKRIAKSTFNAVLLYTIYQSILVFLKTEALKKKGLMSKSMQIQIIKDEVIDSLKNGALISTLLSIFILLVPSMSLPFAMLGIIGIGKSSIDLFNAFWENLDHVQQEELLNASREAGANLGSILR